MSSSPRIIIAKSFSLACFIISFIVTVDASNTALHILVSCLYSKYEYTASAILLDSDEEPINILFFSLFSLTYYILFLFL